MSERYFLKTVMKFDLFLQAYTFLALYCNTPRVFNKLRNSIQAHSRTKSVLLNVNNHLAQAIMK